MILVCEAVQTPADQIGLNQLFFLDSSFEN